MKEELLILVNHKDEPIGTMGKMDVHKRGLLHRAFSIFIFDSQGRMLLQQRALDKYHGGGLWTNACCSHPFPEEGIEQAAKRRLKEELGFSAELKKIFEFTYCAKVNNDLTEHEYDHVFAGQYEGLISANKNEVEAYKYATMSEIKQALQESPDEFTSWFKLAFPTVEIWWEQHYQKNKVV